MTLDNHQLSRICINGFKSIKSCDIVLNKINLLIGSNGAGKSNFISVFAMLQNIIQKQLQFFVAQRGINSLFFNGTKTTEEIATEVFFDKSSYGFTLVPTDNNSIVFKEEHFGYHGAFEKKSTVGERSVVAKGKAESNWDIGVGNQIDSYVRPILRSQNWRVYHFHDTGRRARVKQEHNVSNNFVLAFDAGNLAAFLYRLKNNYIQSYDGIVRTVRMVAPYFDDFVLVPKEENTEQIVLKWRQVGCDDIFNASQFSDGTLRFICLATLLLQPEELLPVTIIIDEPELGLHPYAISLFAEMVHALPEGHQIIISTQSVELLNEFDAEDIIVVDRNDNGSQFKRLDENELNEWLQLDYALGDLWKKNILGGRPSK